MSLPNLAKFVQQLQTSAVVLGILAIATLYSYSFYVALMCPASLSYEGHVLWATYELAHGHNIYALSSLYQPPWSVVIYPPLLPALAAPFMLITGASYLPLRAISIIATVTTVFFLYRICRNNCSKLGSATAVVFFLSMIPVWFTSLLAKPDLLALSLGSIAIYKFIKIWDKTENTLSFFTIAILCTLSCLAKQPMAAIPLAMFFFLCNQKMYSSALKLLGLWLSLLVASILALQNTTGGFIQHLTFFLSQAPWYQERALVALNSLGIDVVRSAVVLLLFGFYLLRQHNGTTFERLPIFLFFIALIIGGYSMGFPGISSNHMITACFAISWLLALALNVIPQALVLVILLSLWTMPYAALFLHQVASAKTSDYLQIIPLLPKHSFVLVEDLYYALKTDNQPAMVDCFSFLTLWRQNPTLLEPLKNQVAKHAYAAIVIPDQKNSNLECNFWPPSIIEQIHTTYTLINPNYNNGTWVFYPKTNSADTSNCRKLPTN